MKSLLLMCVCAMAAFGDDIVFRGTPTLRVFANVDRDERQQLSGDDARKNQCVIVQRGKKYFWASRENIPMTRVDFPTFTYFIHTGGGGYVKVLTGSREKTNSPVDYVENINRGFEVITYWGKVNEAAAPPQQ